MNFLLKVWKKALTLLVAGSTSIFIAACYGMPADYGFLGMWKIRVRNTAAAPISGLSVTILRHASDNPFPDTLDSQLTDSTGSVGFVERFSEPGAGRFDARIHDIDSSLSGGFFRDTVIQKSSDDSTIVILPQ